MLTLRVITKKRLLKTAKLPTPNLFCFDKWTVPHIINLHYLTFIRTFLCSSKSLHIVRSIVNHHATLGNQDYPTNILKVHSQFKVDLANYCFLSFFCSHSIGRQLDKHEFWLGDFFWVLAKTVKEVYNRLWILTCSRVFRFEDSVNLIYRHLPPDTFTIVKDSKLCDVICIKNKSLNRKI